MVKGIDCCTSEPEEEDISGKFICGSCVKEDDYDLAEYGFCEFDTEKSYALHISDLKSDESGFYCKEHIAEVSMEEEEREGWHSYIEYINK